jgi:hypothetical protein
MAQGFNSAVHQRQMSNYKCPEALYTRGKVSGILESHTRFHQSSERRADRLVSYGDLRLRRAEDEPII